MSRIPTESSPADNTRRRAGDRRARVESSSSVESEHLDATVVRHVESDSASIVRLRHLDSEPPRDANISSAVVSTLLIPQPSNPPSNLILPDSVLSALLLQMIQLSSVLAAQDANGLTESRSLAAQLIAQSAAMTAVSDRLDRLERSRSDRNNRESADLQLSVPLPPSSPQSSSTIASRDDIAPTRPPKMRSSIR